MHLADALLSPAVGATMWLASGAVLAASARRVRAGRGVKPNDELVPLMGVLGAFVFAAQMINFVIPGTGSSGHLGGGLLLAILLGPHAALIVIASVLTVQSVFFADGGLLALGANIFNVGVVPCLIVYPLVYRPLAGVSPSPRRAAIAMMCAALVGLQLGALGVVFQTAASGVSSLPKETFLLLMQPIHLAIGLVEGAATLAVVRFVERMQPELLAITEPVPTRPRRPVLVSLIAAAVLAGGFLSWFASDEPDGLEWSIANAATAPIETPSHVVHQSLAGLQQRVAPMPGYQFASESARAGTSFAGLLGGAITLVLIALVALALKRRR